jgi:hypothetical protein
MPAHQLAKKDALAASSEKLRSRIAQCRDEMKRTAERIKDDKTDDDDRTALRDRLRSLRKDKAELLDVYASMRLLHTLPDNEPVCFQLKGVKSSARLYARIVSHRFRGNPIVKVTCYLCTLSWFFRWFLTLVFLARLTPSINNWVSSRQTTRSFPSTTTS